MTAVRRSPIVGAVAAVVVLFAAAVWLQMLRDDRYRLATSDEETLYLTRRATSRVVFAQRALASDLYWIRAIQYYGGHAKGAKARVEDPLEPPPAIAALPATAFDVLYPLLDITTTLDPRFNIAYRFGSIFLSEKPPYGPGRPDQAISLLEKGLAVMPDKWPYWQDVGFVYYWNIHDYTQAARAFNRGADIPGAPWWLRSLAATMLAKGGDRNASRLLWAQLYDTANNDYARNAAWVKLQQLAAIEMIERLQSEIDAFSKRTGSPVTNWNQVVAAGLVRGIPLDPGGVPYELTPSSRVQLSPRSPLFPLPVEPAARGGA